MKKNTDDGVLTSGQSISYWIDSEKQPEYPELNGPLKTDVLIIGGGLAGLTTAYCLLKAGRQVVLVEDGLVASGETGRTTAHLTAALDDRYYDIESAFGEEGSRKAAESHLAAIDWIEKTVAEENIDCSFERVDGYLFLHPSDKPENLDKEYKATKRAGLATEWVDSIPGISGAKGPAIRFPRQGQFHILRYMRGLADAITRMGGQIFTRTKAEDIQEGGAKCNGHSVDALEVVVATNTPVNDRVAIHTKQHPYRTYVIAGKVPRGQLPHCLWWDTGDMDSRWVTAPYHYIRLQEYDDQYDLLISGGEDHKTGQADDEDIPEENRYDNLVQWTKKHFPQMTDIVYKWSGQVMEPVDYMGFIGKNPGDDHVYIITGDSGNGMTHTTIGGLLVTDLITGKDNPWKDLYSPSRIPLKVPGTYFNEVFNMAAQYGDYLKRGDIKEVDELTSGQGAILSKGLRKVAVYKDEGGAIHAFSAVCTHLGCIVQWNQEEKTFDCPCHGSRFTKEGVVINGPATTDLKRVKVED